MFFTYVLRSKVDGSFYKGHCEDLKKEFNNIIQALLIR